MNDKYEVLIVDDIPENLQVLSNILHEKGIDISFSTDGKQALEAVKFNKPDLILLDISMPVMDGFEVCENLQNNPETKEIPIIFLTARTQSEDVVKGFKIGAVDYVTKPFNSSELVSRVFTHLELKKSRDIIKNQNQQLEELNAMKDRFFSIIAHDLKNPFNTLIGFSELLIENFYDYDEAKTLRYLKLIANSSRQGFALLENLLQWSRSQTGRIKIKRKKQALLPIVEEVFELYQTGADRKSINIIIDVPKDLSAVFDKDMIHTIVRNLVSNAIKFTHENGEVVVRAEQKDELVVFSIKDNGTGMSQEIKEKLFRIDVSHTSPGTNQEKGTGLGLILCKEFIEQNQGEIWVESEQDKGSVFYFTLPV